MCFCDVSLTLRSIYCSSFSHIYIYIYIYIYNPKRTSQLFHFQFSFFFLFLFFFFFYYLLQFAGTSLATAHWWAIWRCAVTHNSVSSVADRAAITSTGGFADECVSRDIHFRISMHSLRRRSLTKTEIPEFWKQNVKKKKI